MSNQDEVWRPVAGRGAEAARRYEVSNHGRVRSTDLTLVRLTGPYAGPYRKKGRILSPGVMRPTGHLNVVLYYLAPDEGRNARIHTLVLEAFAGPRPEGMEGCHNDGNPTNNHIDNLRWDTRSANNQDTLRHGRHEKKRRTHCPRQHPLELPNLIPSRWEKRGHRVCYACALATWKRANDRRKGVEIDFEAVADAYYAEIMRAVAA